MPVGLPPAPPISSQDCLAHIFRLSLFLPNVANVGKVVRKCFDLDLSGRPAIFSLLNLHYVVYQGVNVLELLHRFQQWPTPRSCGVLSSTAIGSQHQEPQAPPSLAEPSHWSTQFYKLASDWSAGLAIRLHHIILGRTGVHMQLLRQTATSNCTSCC